MFFKSISSVILSITLVIISSYTEVFCSQRIDSISVSLHLSYSSTKSLAVLGDTLWAGTNGGGIVRGIGSDTSIVQFITTDGLAGNTVNRVVIADTEGSVWAATNNGLSFISARGIESFLVIDSRPLGNVYDMTLLGKRMAAASNGGLVEYVHGEFTLYPSIKTKHVFYSRDSILWAAGESGIITLQNGTAKSQPVHPDFDLRNISGIAVDKGGHLWVTSATDVDNVYAACLNDTGWHFFTLQDSTLPYSAQLIRSSHIGDIVIAGDKGVSQFEDGVWKSLFEINGARFADLTFSNTAQLFYTTGERPYWTGNGNGITWPVRKGLESNNVRLIAVDRNNHLWVSVYSSRWGIHQFNGEDWMIHSAAGSALLHNYATAYAQDSSGGHWFGSNFGISYFLNGNWRAFQQKDGLPYIRVNDIIAAQDGKIWAGCYGGVMMYDGSTWNAYDTSKGLPGTNVLTVAETQEGVIIAGTEKGIAYLENGEFISDSDGSGPDKRFVTSIATSSETHVVVATSNGTFIKDNSTHWIQAIDNDVSCSHSEIDSEGRIWIGTNSGIILLDRDGTRIGTIDTGDGLPGNTIYKLAQNAHGPMWVATNAGLSQVTISTSTLTTSRQHIKIARLKCPESGIYDLKGRRLSAGNTDRLKAQKAAGIYFWREGEKIIRRDIIVEQDTP